MAEEKKVTSEEILSSIKLNIDDEKPPDEVVVIDVANLIMSSLVMDYVEQLAGQEEFRKHGLDPTKYPAHNGYRRWFRRRFPGIYQKTEDDVQDESRLAISKGIFNVNRRNRS